MIDMAGDDARNPAAAQTHRAGGREPTSPMVDERRARWAAPGGRAAAAHRTRRSATAPLGEAEPRSAHLENLALLDLLAWREIEMPRPEIRYWRTAATADSCCMAATTCCR
jgi:hypothetical protein